jgi:chromosome segregation ATPase
MKKIIFYLIPLFTVLLFSCKSEKSELQALKQRLQNDSLLLADMGGEMEEIDKAIGECALFTSKKIDRSTPEKIKEMDNLIASTNEKIKDLEEKISKSNSSFKNTTFLTQALEVQKEKVKEKDEEIKNLNVLLKKYEGRIDDLIKNQGKEIEAQQGLQAQIDRLREENEKLKKEVEAGQSSGKMSLAQVESLKNKIFENQLNSAKYIINLAKDINFNKKRRKDMARKAFDILCTMQKDGYYEARNEINKLKNEDEELKKFVEDLNCYK